MASSSTQPGCVTPGVYRMPWVRPSPCCAKNGTYLSKIELDISYLSWCNSNIGACHSESFGWEFDGERDHVLRCLGPLHRFLIATLATLLFISFLLAGKAMIWAPMRVAVATPPQDRPCC